MGVTVPPSALQGRASLASSQLEGCDSMQLAADLIRRGIAVRRGAQQSRCLPPLGGRHVPRSARVARAFKTSSAQLVSHHLASQSSGCRARHAPTCSAGFHRAKPLPTAPKGGAHRARVGLHL
jgi:selenocysteine lyase/cysteine desulfurase